MTATAPPPVVAPPPTDGRKPEGARRGSPLPMLAIGELTLATVTLVTIVSMGRVFAGTEWLWGLGGQAVAAFALAAVLRRAAVPFVLSTVIGLGAGTVVISVLYARESTFAGLPTRASFQSLANQVNDAFTGFSDVSAPVEAASGFLIVVAAAVWLCAIVGDWWAFRAGATLESTFPPITLFVLFSILGDGSGRVVSAAAFAGSILLFLVARRADRMGQSAVWVGRHRHAGPRAVLALGATIAVSATVLAGLATPFLPGSQSEGMVDLTDLADSGNEPRITVSPLVDIRERLIEQADVEVFTVRASSPAYWRLTSLNEFDGRVWRTTGSYSRADGRLGAGAPVEAGGVDIDQEFTITALDQIWLPAAYEPQRLDAAVDARYDDESGTIIVDNHIDSANDATYRVTSVAPIFAAADLAAASTEVPSDIASYTELPADFPAPVVELAEQVTTEASSPFEQALALQTFLRTEFTYDLDVSPSQSSDAISRFLFETRRGYCQQFAGSFAAMARGLGIPARVAVGFTPGDPDPDDPTSYSVRGRYAHAWPEVFLGEFGWVAFEPTPGRGAPFAEAYTGVEPQQASATEPGAASEPLPAPAPDPVPDEPTPTTEPPATGDEGDAETDTPLPEDTASASNPWLGRVAMVLGISLAIVAAYVAAVVAFDTSRRARRRRHAVSAEARVALAWDEAGAAIRPIGIHQLASETQDEFATRVRTRLPDAAATFGGLADRVRTVTFAPGEMAGGPDDEAYALADDVRDVVLAGLSTRERVAVRFHPKAVVDRVLKG